MTNTAGFTTLTPLELQRTCFADEQDRLREYAKALRVPIQIGQIIKGDPGPQGERGPKGEKGLKGDNGATPILSTAEYAVDSGVSMVVIPSLDARDKIINLLYDDEVNPPGTILGIKCIRFTGAGDTEVYLTGTTTDALYKVVVSSF